MKTVNVIIICLLLGVMCLPIGAVRAADEDTQASVYLVFDPETGEFVTVDDPSVTAQHEAALDKEAIESVADTASSGGAAMTDGATPKTNSPLIWTLAAAIVALLGAGGFAWSRRARQTAS